MADTDAVIQIDDHPSRKMRSAIRMRARAKVECRAGMSGMSPNVASSLANVSNGGALIAAHTPIEIGRAVEMRFTGPEDRHSFIVLGRIVRCDTAQAGGYFLGVKFDKPMPGQDLARLVHSGKIVEG